jgi:hypothetical protein
MKIFKGGLYTWKGADIPVYVLAHGKAIDMVHVLTEDNHKHYIDSGNLIELTLEHGDLDWCRLLSDDGL